MPVEVVGHVYRATRRTGAELLSIPGAVAFSALAAPVYYFDTQWRELRQAPGQHLLDTLAQLPVLEAGVGLADRWAGREIPSGRRSKGLFSLGALHESFGRVAAPNLLSPSWSIFGPALPLQPPDASGCSLPRCQGLVVVDVSDLSGGSLFGDLRQPWRDYTLGWFDLVGAHSTYTEPELGRFLTRLFQALPSPHVDPAAAIGEP
jgi:hypothetical protein